jgi:hypothetical protein
MTADLPTTPPADEALRQELISQVMRYENTDADIIADDILHFIKSHAEQEKAAAVLAARIDELLWVTKMFDDAHVDTVIDFRIHGLRKELAELRDGGGKG